MRPCDLFSVDGDHTHNGAKADILNAIMATRHGGTIVLDDMEHGQGSHTAFDEVVGMGQLRNVHCTMKVDFNISHIHRYDTSNVRHQRMSWCFATVA